MLQLLRTRRFAPLFFTQLGGALNDNLLKSALVVVITFGGEGRADVLVALSTALLVLPYFLFSAVAGRLADRVDKAKLARALKTAELGVAGVAAVGLVAGSLPVLLVSLFLIGTQSALFGPVKYALLPQHLRDDELVAGNGLVEAGTFGAILGGTVLGGLAVGAGAWGAPLVAALLCAVALGGWLAARAIPTAPPSPDAPAMRWNLAGETGHILRLAARDRAILGALLATAWGWLMGALLLSQIPLVASALAGAGAHTLTAMLALFSVGVGAGAAGYAGAFRGRVEPGMLPLAALALSAFTFDFAHASTGGTDAALSWRMGADLLGMGAGGGLFLVPLQAFVQKRAPEAARARIVAAGNVLDAAFMVAASLAAIALSSAGLSPQGVLAVGAVANLVAAAAVAVVVRRHLLRLLVGRVVRATYRLRVRGLEHVPAEGPALVVCNHVSFVDALVLGGLCRRPLRFVVDHRVARVPVLRPIFRLARTIPIAARHEDPALLERAYADIDDALADGEVVAIFPEGRLTRDGEIGPFRPGIQRILSRRPVPVVPVALRGLWGSFFSHAGGRAMAKWPRRLWSRVEVVAGRAVAPGLVTAEMLRAEVAALHRSHGES